MTYSDILSIFNANCVKFETGKMIGARCSEAGLRKYGIYNALCELYQEASCIHEMLYCLRNGIMKRPVCKACGKSVGYSKQFGFATFCSRSCSNNDPEVLAKNKAGVSKALKQAYAERGNEINRKRAKSLTGDENGTCTPFGVKKWQDKAKATILERYGVDNVFRLKEFHETKEQYWERCRKLWLSRGIDITYEDGYATVHNACPKHPEIKIPTQLLHARIRRCPKLAHERWDTTFLCRECHPVYKTNIERFVSDVLERMGIEYRFRDRQEIRPYEIDFYLPGYNIGIETNGVYWHSAELTDVDVMKTKYQMCYDKKLRLVTLWEDDIIDHGPIMEALLKSLILGFDPAHFEGLDIQEFMQTSVVLEKKGGTVVMDSTGLYVEYKNDEPEIAPSIQPIVMKDTMWLMDEVTLWNPELTLVNPDSLCDWMMKHHADGSDFECVHLGAYLYMPGNIG